MTPAGRRTKVLFWAVFVTLLAYGLFNLASSASWLNRTFPGFVVHRDGAVDPLLPQRWSGATAGIQVGDRIVAVQHVPVTSGSEAYQHVATLAPGTSVTYELLRTGAGGSLRLSRTVPTARFGWRDWVGIPGTFWLVGMVNLLIGALVSLLKPRDPVARAHLAFCWLMALYFLGVFDGLSTHHLVGIPSLLAQGLLGSAALSLASLLPRRVPVVERHPWLRTANWVVGGVLAIGTAALYYTGDSFLAVKIILVVCALGGLPLPLAALWTTWSATSSGQERSQARIILWGAVAAFLPSVLLMLVGVLRGSIPLDLPELSFGGLLLFPSAIGYAILRHGLFDLDEVVTRAVTYALVSAALLLAYLGLTTGVRSLWTLHDELVDVVAAGTIAVAFAPLRDWTKTRVDRFFLRTDYDLTRLVADFGDLARTTLDREPLVEGLFGLLAGALHPRYVALFTRSGDQGLALCRATGLESGTPPLLSLEHPYLQHLLRSERSLAQGEASDTPFSDAVWLPMVVKEEVQGCLMVGPKKSGARYRSQDRLLLLSLAQQLSLWLHNAQLVETVVHQTKELEQVEALKEADRLKDEFLSIISHELRTPISIIKGFGTVLKGELKGPVADVQHYYLDKILSASGMLAYLVNDLLDMSRIRAGKLRLHPSAFRFDELVDEVSASFEPLAIEHHQAILAEVPEDLPLVYGDRQRIAQVLANLLGNAIKFSPEHGTIWVRASAQDDELLCEVRDEGRGISAEDLPKLFQRFTQLDMTATRQVGGTGLGLSISKSLIEAQRGRIGVLSTPGEGSTFWFSLPIVTSDD